MRRLGLRALLRDEFGDVCVVTSCKTLGLEGGHPLPRFFVSVNSGEVEVEWNQQLSKC
jgi:hypothetical protein